MVAVYRYPYQRTRGGCRLRETIVSTGRDADGAHQGAPRPAREPPTGLTGRSRDSCVQHTGKGAIMPRRPTDDIPEHPPQLRWILEVVPHHLRQAEAMLAARGQAPAYDIPDDLLVLIEAISDSLV